MLEAGHFLLLIVVFLIVGLGFNKALQAASYADAKRKSWLRGYALLVILWLAYVSAVSASGIIATFSLPPRMPLMIILPAFAIIIWFHNSKRFKEVREAFPIELTVYFQSFRIFVELLILGLYYKDIGPEIVTFEGYNFDILAGFSAPLIGYLAYSRKVLSHKMVLAWNIICLLLLANTVLVFLTVVFKPDVWGYATPPVSIEFTQVPYIFIAAVFMPLAVFMHVLSIKKTMKAIKEPKQA